MVLEDTDLDKIDLEELDQIRDDITRFYLNALCENVISPCRDEKYIRKSRRHCFRIGRKLEKILRGEKTYVKSYPVLSSLSINLLCWITSPFSDIGRAESSKDHLLRLSSLLKLALSNPESYPNGFDYNPLKGRLYETFEELGIWAKEIQDFLVDPETYLQSHLYMPFQRNYDGDKAVKPKEGRGLQFLLFEPGKTEDECYNFF